MKKLTLLLSALFILSAFNSAEAQIWKKLKKKAEKKIEKKVEKEIDDVLEGEKKEEKTEESTKRDSEKTEEESNTPDSTNGSTETISEQKKPEVWRNFKFIPGEEVVFYDDLKFEEVGEFPSRWDLEKGGVEVAQLNGEKVILGTTTTNNRIIPLFDSENYLTDEFTIEFDVFIDNQNNGITSNYNISFDGRDNIELEFFNNYLNGLIKDKDKNFKMTKVDLGKQDDWHHISVSFYKGKLKVYYDEKRVANIPKYKITPSKIEYISVYSLYKDRNPAIKNIRIAHGGGQMYKRIIADGKYTTNGILFDSGKAIIKLQSMGILNKVATVMNENPDWRFQIIGHTDSDGTDNSNLTLSQQRAEAVKLTLVTLGIKADRLSTLGKGESEPVNTNTSPEEKANNRRVEFIKQ